MMRSLYSGVAGLKTHQTKMDVIGNNIANVNTTAFKAQTITFNELMYQTTKRASGASTETSVGGTNAGQIGLGVKVGSMNTNISTQGAMQTTNLPFDIAITGDSFFVVSNGFENFFTRAGSFYIDGAGNLAMTSTGYNVMGWQVDPENPNNIKQDTVSPILLIDDSTMTYGAEATTKATVAGVIDRNDPDINSTTGKIMNLEFFDDQGFKFTARLSAHVINADRGEYYVKLDDILDSTGRSIGPEMMGQVSFGMTEIVETAASYLTRSGTAIVNRDIVLERGTDTHTAVISNPARNYTIGGTPADPDAMTPALLRSFYGDMVGDLVDAAVTAGTPIQYSLFPDGTLTMQIGTANPVSYALSGVGQPGGASATITDIEFARTQPVALNVPLPVGQVLELSDVDLDEIEQIFGIRLDHLGVIEFQIEPNGTLTVIKKQVDNAAIMRYNSGNGQFNDIAGNTQGLISIQFNKSNPAVDMDKFQDIEINFINTLTNNNNARSTISASAGGTGEDRGLGTGRRKGEMIEVVVQDDGKIYATYDNGMSRLLAQIAVATFANPSGLEKKGDNLYSASMNSGDFDNIGQDIKSAGGYMTSGVLEMSNVDLSSEFTEMITTQRGFQANSRIITVSDSLLEELTNLKR
ncbi:MAG: flagellar hook-basal body complex protein [Lachnospiraceae bacterium]|nr:flagellar hook-basal body complex protein [Lachnospiraceae bacterium]